MNKNPFQNSLSNRNARIVERNVRSERKRNCVTVHRRNERGLPKAAKRVTPDNAPSVTNNSQVAADEAGVVGENGVMKWVL